MKMITKAFAILLMNLSLAYGYGGQPPPPQFESVEVNGPPLQVPLFLTGTDSLTFFLQASFYSPSSIDGKINVEGTSSVSPASNKNLEWKISSFAINTGFSFKIWETQELFLTLKVDHREKGIAVTGSDFGTSFLIAADKNIRGRLDLGLSYLGMSMELELYDQNDSSFIRKNNNDVGVAPFASLTIQSAFDNWVINTFLQTTYGRQVLFSHVYAGRDIFSAITIIALTPGITFRLNKNIMFIAGGSYFIPSGIENKSSPGIYSGFVQANFLF